MNREAVLASLLETLQRREEFARLSMDRQGELIVQLGEALGAISEETGLEARIVLANDAPAFVCPDHPDSAETMLVETEFNDDHEGHFFETRIWCPMCGAEFGGALCRTEGDGELL